MSFLKIIMILGLLWCSADARAQVASEPSSMPEQWQLTLDVIKAKAQTLLIKNNQIRAEYRKLIEQAQELKQTLKDQQDKNEAIRLLLNQRHGRTDQQVRLDDLQQTVKTKRQQAREFQERLENLQKKQLDLGREIQSQRRKAADIQRHQQDQKKETPAPEAVGAPDGQLTDLRRQLEEEKKQEVILEDQLSSLKSGGPSQNLDVHAIEEANKQLQLQLKDLQEQKSKKSPEGTLGTSQQLKYDELKKRKDQLEAAIRAYEMRLDQLRYSSGLTSSWAVEKKKLIHEMVQKDARNNQLREKIKILREDVDILKDQVAKLERRVNFMQGQNKT